MPGSFCIIFKIKSLAWKFLFVFFFLYSMYLPPPPKMLKFIPKRFSSPQQVVSWISYPTVAYFYYFILTR